MTDKGVKQLLQQREGLRVEFKESLFKLNRNTFETVGNKFGEKFG
jgi:hypothetical protein